MGAAYERDAALVAELVERIDGVLDEARRRAPGVHRDELEAPLEPAGGLVLLGGQLANAEDVVAELRRAIHQQPDFHRIGLFLILVASSQGTFLPPTAARHWI